MRPSCHNCKAKENKLSDITIADFWGIEEVAPEMDDGKGTSLVLVRTEKGKTYFEKMCSELKYKQVTYSDAIKNNPAECQSVNRPVQREKFFIDMNNMSFEELQKKYIPANNSFKYRIKKIIKGIIGYPWKKSGGGYGIKIVFDSK